MSDDSLQEVPQRSLPKVSILWMLGMVTASALLFLIFKMAFGGSRWAQVASLVVGVIIGTLISYASLFLLGAVADSILTLLGRERRVPKSRLVNESKKTSTSLVLVFSFLLPTSVGFAETVWQGRVPSKPAKLGYTVSTGLARHPGPGGYQVVQFRVAPTGQTFSRDHSFSVTVSEHSQCRSRLAAATTSTFQAKQSGSTFVHEMLIPRITNADSLRVRVSEDGAAIGDRPQFINFNNQLDHRFAGQSITMGVIDPTQLGMPELFPDLRALSVIAGQTALTPAPLPEDAERLKLSNKDALEFATQVQPCWIQYRVFDPTEMPTTWLALSDLDALLVHQKDLPTSSDAITTGTQTVLRWVASGGSLLVYGDNPKLALSEHESISPQIFIPFGTRWIRDEKGVRASLRLGEENDTSELTDQYWFGNPVKRSSNMAGLNFDSRQEVFDDLVNASNPMVSFKAPAEIAGQLEVANYGLGEIITIQQNDPFPGSFQFWSAIQNQSEVLRRNDVWASRRGVDVQAGNTNYWRWLIDSVGGPPVKSFLMLNTLFVLTVGPIAYFLLRRAGRLYLLYFCGPALAILVMGGLFAFAIFSDGIGTKLRTHQWTWIDLPAQVAVEQSRDTYYSSFGAGELAFPDDAMVLPVLPISIIDRSNYTGESIYPGGRVVWSGDRQIWKGDFLPTRSQVQYQVVRPKELTRPVIRFEPVDEAGSNYRIHNDRTTSIGPMIFCDQNGSFFRVESVGPGESETMTPASSKDMLALVDQRVLPPAGIVPNVRSNWSLGYNNLSPSDEVSLLEKRLESWRNSLPNNHFVGLTELDTDRFATESPEVSGSLHVLMGRAQ